MMYLQKKVLCIALILIIIFIGLSEVSALSTNIVPRTGHCFTPLTAGPYSGDYLCTNNITSYDGIMARIKVDSGSGYGWINSTWATNISNTSIISSAIVNTSVEVTAMANVILQTQIFNSSASDWINVSDCNYTFTSSNNIENKLCDISAYVSRGIDISSLIVRSLAYRTSGGGAEEKFDMQVLSLVYNPESPPVVFLDTPVNGTVSLTRTVDFNATFTDDNALINSTLYIWNSTNALINTTTRTLNGTQNQTSITVVLPYDGTFLWNYLAGDSGGNNAFNATNFTLTVDTVKPLVQMTLPQNTTYNSIQTSINYTVSDLNLQSCWYSTNGGLTNISVSCGVNVTGLNSGQGSSTWIVGVNDSAGNINQSSKTFVVDSLTPSIQFVSPTLSSGTVISANTFVVNVSASDTTLQNITIRLYNTTGLVQQNLSSSEFFSVNYTELSDGIYFYNATATDIFNSQNTTETRNIIIDRTAPEISFVSPLSANYSNINILVNISASGASSVWFFNGTGNQTYISPVFFNFSEGNHTLIAYANDSIGNLNSTQVIFTVDITSPSITILLPVNGSTLGNNQSIPFNFSVIENNLANCWYNIDGSVNVTVSGCANTSLNTSNGNHVVRLYANDSAGNIGSSSTSFSVQVGAPSISLISPINTYLNYGEGVSLIYIPSDIDLLSCILWGNFNGTFGINQTYLTPVSSVQNSFSVDLNDGIYSWAISCNDSIGNSAMSANQTFFVDTTLPNVSLSAPSGTFTSLSNIPITLSVSDASPVQCRYNITFAATGNVVVSNSELLNCASTTFTLDTESSYFFNLAVNDSAGNTNITRKSFTVSIPSGGGNPGGSSSGGSSSGGSSGGIISGVNSFNLNFGVLDTLKINRGESEAIELPVTNKGLRFLNNCHFFAKGGVSNWISGEDVQSLSPGQTTKYIFNVNVPIDAEVGDYFVTIGANCAETNATFTHGIEVTGGEFEVTILNSERIGTKLRVEYAIENFGDNPKNIIVNYKLIGKENNIIVDGSVEPVEVLAGERFEGTAEFELPKNSIGDYSLVIEATDGLDMAQKEQEVRLSTGGVVGFAISDNNLKILGWFGLVILLSFGIYLVLKTIRHQLALRRANSELNRQFIAIDLNH